MPQCLNCDNRVTEQYARVKCGKLGPVKACPNCEGRKLQNGEVYEYRG